MYLSGIQTEIAKKFKMLILPLVPLSALFKATPMGAQHRCTEYSEKRNQTQKKHFASLE